MNVHSGTKIMFPQGFLLYMHRDPEETQVKQSIFSRCPQLHQSSSRGSHVFSKQPARQIINTWHQALGLKPGSLKWGSTDYGELSNEPAVPSTQIERTLCPGPRSLVQKPFSIITRGQIGTMNLGGKKKNLTFPDVLHLGWRWVPFPEAVSV